MSTIRDKARAILDAALPESAVYLSVGPTASKYTELTGIPHKTLADKWDPLESTCRHASLSIL